MIAKFAIIWVLISPSIKAEGIAGYELSLKECKETAEYMRNIHEIFFNRIPMKHYCKIIWEVETNKP